jgi:ankyrin repeat protein
MNILLSRSFSFHNFLFAVVLFITLACSAPASCGEIHDAAEKGDLQKVEALLKDNPKLVSIRNDTGQTPLHYAAIFGRKDMAALLLAHNANVNVRDYRYGYTPLHWAAGHAYSEAAMALLSNMDEADWTPSSESNKDIAELLLSHKADVNVKGSNGETPLHRAAFFNKDIVELLLAKGAKVNAKDNNGSTPLHVAAKRGHKEVTELLLASKAEVDARDNNGWTPLHWAEAAGHKNVVELLRQHGGHE